MKKIISLLVILVTMYFIVADGMMTVFNLSRGIQYAFNFGAILLLIPFGFFVIVQEKVL
jgi:hypothetical protein